MNTNQGKRPPRQIGRIDTKSSSLSVHASYGDSEVLPLKTKSQCTLVSIRVHSWLFFIRRNFGQLRREQAFLFFLVQRQTCGRDNRLRGRFNHEWTRIDTNFIRQSSPTLISDA